VLVCGCNGSSLPLYIGPPPPEATPHVAASCTQHPDHYAAAAIAIGYADRVPQLGTIDAERAQEIIVALACRVENADAEPPFGSRASIPVANYSHAFIGWELRLPAPYAIVGDEPYLDAIQRIRRS
jgi:hypothetical protein